MVSPVPVIGGSAIPVGVTTDGTITIDSIADLRLISGTSLVDNQRAVVLGYYTEGDGGGGDFYWDADSVASDNGGIVFLPTGHSGAGRWLALDIAVINVKRFGAKGDASTDDTTAIANALTAAAGGACWFPEGSYISSPIAWPDDVTVYGDGMRRTTLKMKSSSNADFIVNASISGATIRDMTIDGNSSGNSSGMIANITTDSAADGPALSLENILFTGGPLGSGNESVFISGLAWIYTRNVRYVNNKGTLWLSTNDSIYDSLYVGNSGVVATVPSVVIGGNSNKFKTAYFGGNGASTSTAASQVKFIGASYNTLEGCTNDSANGHGYEFADNGATYCIGNQIVGGAITNPSQNTTNTYSHVVWGGNSTDNIVKGAFIGNTLAKVGKYGVAETGSAGGNLVHGCQVGTMGTSFTALIGANASRIIECPGFTPQGMLNVAVGASPFTYTNNDNVNELVQIADGTVSSVVKNAVTFFGVTNVSLLLSPGESVIVTYSSLPIINVDRR